MIDPCAARSQLTRAGIPRNSGGWLNTSHEQVIPGPSTGDIQQIALGVVDVFQVCIVVDGFKALLQ